MTDSQHFHTGVFAEVAAAVRAMTFRSDLSVHEVPAPQTVTEHALALGANVRWHDAAEDSPYGAGRIMVLFDPEEPEPWGGPWRIVAFAQAPLETEIATDPMLTAVAWSWLMDALSGRGATHVAAAGTATKTLSTGFGSLAEEGDGAQIELRASWSPTGRDLTAHVDAWAELVCMLAGLPPGSEDAPLLSARRGGQ